VNKKETIKIVTWNMAHWSHKKLSEEAWNYFLNNIDADFFLFQEASPPDKIKKQKRNLAWNEIGGSRSWGSGIYSKKYELKEEIIKTEFKGVFSVANAMVNSKKITLISLYGLMESDGPTKGFAITNLHKVLSDLTGLFWGRIDGNRKIILGGDLNASLQIDKKQKGNSHKIFFDRLEDFGLFDCFKILNKKYPMQTLRHKKSKTAWQNDYFFVSKEISEKVINCEVIDNKEIRKYSDHNLVTITLDL
jgi:exonuclease III